jgi:hypothetical protein
VFTRPTNSYVDQYNQRNNALGAALGLSSTGDPNAASNYSLNNDYAVGSRSYGPAGMPSPTAGPGSVNPAGYQQRDQYNNARRQALYGLAQRGN